MDLMIPLAWMDALPVIKHINCNGSGGVLDKIEEYGVK